MTHDEKRFQDFFRAYLEAALWSSTDNADDTGGEPLDSNYDYNDIHLESVEAMWADCLKFYSEHSGLWSERDSPSGEWTIDEQAGHDFWLTRNRHGAGFWDRSPEVYSGNGDRLTDAAHGCGESVLYVGDDGRLHID